VLVILGFLVLVFGSFEYSIYSHNKDTLEWNEAWGADTPDQHELVASQFRLAMAAFILGTLFVIFGIAVLASAASFNRSIDDEEFKADLIATLRTQQVVPGVKSFCQYCGRQLAPGGVWCPGCGRRVA